MASGHGIRVESADGDAVDPVTCHQSPTSGDFLVAPCPACLQAEFFTRADHDPDPKPELGMEATTEESVHGQGFKAIRCRLINLPGRVLEGGRHESGGG